jgi:hypothetical protein
MAPKLQPYAKLPSEQPSELAQKSRDAIKGLNVDEFRAVEGTDFAVARVEVGYVFCTYDEPKKAGAGNGLANEIYLGANEDEAIAKLLEFWALVRNNKTAAQQQLAAAMNAAAYQMQLQQSMQSNAYVEPYYPSGSDVIGLAPESTYSAPATPTYSTTNVYSTSGQHLGYTRPSGSTDGTMNIYNSNGFVGYARPTGSADGRWNVFNSGSSGGGYAGFIRPSGSADGTLNVYDSNGKYVGFAR